MTAAALATCRCGSSGWIRHQASALPDLCSTCNPFGARDYPGDYSCAACQGVGSLGEPDGPVCGACRGFGVEVTRG